MNTCPSCNILTSNPFQRQICGRCHLPLVICTVLNSQYSAGWHAQDSPLKLLLMIGSGKLLWLILVHIFVSFLTKVLRKLKMDRKVTSALNLYGWNGMESTEIYIEKLLA